MILEADDPEHSIEMQLPFIKYIMPNQIIEIKFFIVIVFS
jgi:AmmeMemoRadiSam system protein B